MTPTDRFERQLPAALTDLADERTPEYFNDLIGRTARSRQRPAWSFPGRWIPVADIASRPAFVPRLPWRGVGVALVIIALLVAGALFVGSRQTRLPPPFGVAGNGMVAYAGGGDIFTVDPISGVATAIVTGPEIDSRPVYSNDGTKIVFLRRHDIGAQTAYDLLVAGADGSDPRVISLEPLGLDIVTSWSADGASLLVGTADGTLTWYDAIGSAPPTVLAHRGRVVPGEIRPADGAQILFEPDVTPEIDLWIMNTDGTDARPIIPASALRGTGEDLDQVRWSPDGTMIAFTCTPSDGSEGRRICVVAADGSGLRALTDASGAWVETDFKWSPDGHRIAFNRWRQDPGTGAWLIQPIGVASVDGGPVADMGLAPASEGALFDWSPDGATLLSLPARFSGSADPNAMSATPVAIDVTTGTARDMPWEVASDVSWQRTAVD